MLFLATGLAVTTSSIALASLAIRKVLATASGRVLAIGYSVYRIPALVGAVIITALGAILFFSPLAI